MAENGPNTSLDEPIACSLSPSAASGRQARWRELADRALLDYGRTPEGARQTYRADPGVEGELRELIDLEAECCAFLDFELSHGAGGLVLEVRGPQEASRIIDMFASVESS